MHAHKSPSVWRYCRLARRTPPVLPSLTSGRTLGILLVFIALGATALAAAEPTDKDAPTSAAPTPTPTVATEMSAADGSQAEPADGQAAPTELPVSAKILRYASRLIRRYDTNRDSQLQENEWRAMRGDPRLADIDSNGLITHDEMARRIADYGYRRKIRLIPKSLETAAPSPAPALLQPMTTSPTEKETDEPMPNDKPAAAEDTLNVTEQAAAKHDFRPGQRFYVAPRHRVQGLPGWFHSRDAKGDQQLSVSEFAPKATQSDIKEFSRHDTNGDGVITAKECVRKAASPTSTSTGSQNPSQ